MGLEKVIVRDKKTAKEVHARLKLFDRRLTWEEIPGVWIIRPPEVEEEVGEIISIVTFADFYGDDTFHQAYQVLDYLNTFEFDQGASIPPERYPDIERAIRRANDLLIKVGDFHVSAEDAVRRAETLYGAMVDFTTIKILREDKSEDRVTVATKMARWQAQSYKEDVLDKKRTRDEAKNLYRALSNTLSSFMVISSKLKKEYEQINSTTQGQI